MLSGLGQGGRSGWFGNPLVLPTPSGAEGELVLLDGLFDPGPQTGLVEGLDECLLSGVVLCGCLLGVMVRAGLEHFDPQEGRQLERKRRHTIGNYFRIKQA